MPCFVVNDPAQPSTMMAVWIATAGAVPSYKYGATGNSIAKHSTSRIGTRLPICVSAAVLQVLMVSSTGGT